MLASTISSFTITASGSTSSTSGDWTKRQQLYQTTGPRPSVAQRHHLHKNKRNGYLETLSGHFNGDDSRSLSPQWICTLARLPFMELSRSLRSAFPRAIFSSIKCSFLFRDLFSL
ncbi:hypothetical protein EYF80_026993 [Liparis tanakae]|uniref:Uncharacterized protein n=1 Tax=Liparis tanakae TaxID=230148 RepID=A0A4Z2HA41_9TELE|nr:hypothetical protein EYF80_026993 [Liparis tanakae]